MSRGLLNLAFSQRPIIETICEYVPNAARILREAGFTIIHSALQVQRRVPKIDFAMADYYIDGLFIGSTNISGVAGVSVTLTMSLFSKENGPLYHLAMVPAVKFSQIARAQSHPTHVHKQPHEISLVEDGSFVYVYTRLHANFGVYGYITHQYSEGCFLLYVAGADTEPQEIRRIAYSDVTRFSKRVHDQDFGNTSILPLTHLRTNRLSAVEALITANQMPLQNVVTRQQTEDLRHHLLQANAFIHLALLIERQHEIETLNDAALDRFATRCWNHDHDDTVITVVTCAYGRARLIKTRCRHPRWTQESRLVNDRMLETISEVALRHIELQKASGIKHDLPIKIMIKQNVAMWTVDTGSNCNDAYQYFS